MRPEVTEGSGVRPIALLVIAIADRAFCDGSLETGDGQNLRNECRGILGPRDLLVSETCVRGVRCQFWENSPLQERPPDQDTVSPGH